jgi:hypothetical protein
MVDFKELNSLYQINTNNGISNISEMWNEAAQSIIKA